MCASCIRGRSSRWSEGGPSHWLRRDVWLDAPAFALKLALGRMAPELLLEGQRVLPARAQELGFEFRYPELQQALSAELGGDR